MRCFAGIQGGQVVAPDLARIERLARRGVRMLGFAHVMDTPLAGSGTGRAAGGLTALGREAVAEAERVGVLVDIAHASVPAIDDALRPRDGRSSSATPGSRHWLTAAAGGAVTRRRRATCPTGSSARPARQGALVGVTFATDLVGRRLDGGRGALDHPRHRARRSRQVARRVRLRRRPAHALRRSRPAGPDRRPAGGRLRPRDGGRDHGSATRCGCGARPERRAEQTPRSAWQATAMSAGQALGADARVQPSAPMRAPSSWSGTAKPPATMGTVRTGATGGRDQSGSARQIAWRRRR